LKPGIKPTPRDPGIRGGIINTMQRAMSRAAHKPDISGCELHGDQTAELVLGRLVERGLHDELRGTAYAIIEAVTGGRAISCSPIWRRPAMHGPVPLWKRVPMTTPVAMRLFTALGQDVDITVRAKPRDRTRCRIRVVGEAHA
jgi:hypothetical protein